MSKRTTKTFSMKLSGRNMTGMNLMTILTAMTRTRTRNMMMKDSVICSSIILQ